MRFYYLKKKKGHWGQEVVMLKVNYCEGFWLHFTILNSRVWQQSVILNSIKEDTVTRSSHAWGNLLRVPEHSSNFWSQATFHEGWGVGGGGGEEDAIKCSDQFPVSYIEVHNPCGPGGQHQAHITNPKRQGVQGWGAREKRSYRSKRCAQVCWLSWKEDSRHCSSNCSLFTSCKRHAAKCTQQS